MAARILLQVDPLGATRSAFDEASAATASTEGDRFLEASHRAAGERVTQLLVDVAP